MALPKKSDADVVRPHSYGNGPSGRPSARQIAERDARRNFVETPNHVLLGDPPPGRSALDGYVPQGAYKGVCREKW